MNRRGTSLIDFLLSIAIIAILFTGVFAVYASIVNAVQNVGARSAAVAALGNEIETIRNLPYASVGTTGGIPPGVIPQSQTSTVGNFSFTLQTTVLNIDDPFDAAPSSSPVTDYKLVSVTAKCPSCQNFLPITITTTVSSNNLTSGTNYGSIFIYAIDANGVPVANASVRVVNASATPSIDFTDTTNASGVLELIGVPTSTQGYQIFASKTGYSSAQTYAPSVSNPNPTSPNVTVVAQTVSPVTFAIDAVSSVNISTVTNRCVAVPNESIAMSGTKLIGTNPNILKFSTTTQTNASGTLALSNIEWDTYSFVPTTVSQDLVGTIPLVPLTIDPSSTQNMMFVFQPATDPSLLVTVIDNATGLPIPNASVTLTKGAFSQALTTDHATFAQSDWSGSNYSSQDGGLDAETNPGALTLAINASGTYTTGASDWLISNTFDIGGTSSTFNAISWTPTTEPPSTGANSISFQVAANNDNATWNFVGPDGGPSTFFTTTPATLPALLAGNRYFRYKVFMTTQDPATSPTLHDVTVDFIGNCVPPGQVLFTGLGAGTYNLDVTANGYPETTSTASVSSGEASSSVAM